MTRSLAAGLAAALVGLAGCARAPAFHLVAGPEQRSLAPLVQRYCAMRRVRCEIEYRNPVDVGLMLAAERPPAIDAVWPASSLWLGLYDTRHRVRDAHAIAASPVVLGVRMDEARRLGWIGRRVTMADIEAAARTRRLTYLAPTASRSSVGALAYLEIAAGLARGPIDAAAFDDPALRARLAGLLGAVTRTSGSAVWLKDLYLSTAKGAEPYPAIWTTEALLKETNDGLKIERRPRLYAIYPAEGVAYADAPLGFVERGQDPRLRAFFRDLQAWLLSGDTQAKIARMGRRPVVAGVSGPGAEPDWNFDLARAPAGLTLPPPAVVDHALTVYQEALRRPSATAYCLDFSGSMRGAPQDRVKAAMAELLTPGPAARSRIQSRAEDRIVALPYDDQVRQVTAGDGTPAGQARVLAAVQAEDARGGGDIYGCARRAVAEVRGYAARGYLPAVVVLTDGHAPGRPEFEKFWRREGGEVPVFAISVGKADKRDLEGLAGLTQARVFDGEPDLAEALRSSRAYN